MAKVTKTTSKGAEGQVVESTMKLATPPPVPVRKVGAAGKVATGTKTKAPKVQEPKVQEPKPEPKPKADPEQKKKEAAERLAKLKAAKAEQKAEAAKVREAHRETAKGAWDSITRLVPCACGCGEQVPVRRFRPGHDAKLHSRLLNGEQLPQDAILTVSQER